MESKAFKGILLNIHNNTLKKKRKCLFEHCNEESIQSHLLQKNGVINHIAEHQHIYQNILSPFEEFYFDFKRTGLNDALTCPAFCNKHDTELFQEIETPG